MVNGPTQFYMVLDWWSQGRTEKTGSYAVFYNSGQFIMPAEIMSRNVTQNSKKGKFIPHQKRRNGLHKIPKKEISALIV